MTEKDIYSWVRVCVCVFINGCVYFRAFVLVCVRAGVRMCVHEFVRACAMYGGTSRFAQKIIVRNTRALFVNYLYCDNHSLVCIFLVLTPRQ